MLLECSIHIGYILADHCPYGKGEADIGCVSTVHPLKGMDTILEHLEMGEGCHET